MVNFNPHHSFPSGPFPVQFASIAALGCAAELPDDPHATVDIVSYREMPAPGPLGDLAECMWVNDGPRQARILPDGCMDLVEMNGTVLIAGPDTSAFVSNQRSAQARGIRFRPGVLPRLLGVPASALRDMRVPLGDLRIDAAAGSLTAVTRHLLRREPTRETTPWSLTQLAGITARLSAGAEVSAVADEIGWSTRNLQRQCVAVFGYGPATVRQVLRFRRAVRLLRAGVPVAETAAVVGYADQSHLYRHVHALAGVPVSQLLNAANRSTDVPSGSSTVA